jgi:hypothetical protein
MSDMLSIWRSGKSQALTLFGWWFHTCFIFHNKVGIFLPIWLTYFSGWLKPQINHCVIIIHKDHRIKITPEVSRFPFWVNSQISPGQTCSCPNSTFWIKAPEGEGLFDFREFPPTFDEARGKTFAGDNIKGSTYWVVYGCIWLFTMGSGLYHRVIKLPRGYFILINL